MRPRQLLERLRTSLGNLSPVLIAGIVVFALGFAVTLINAGDADAEFSLARSFNRIFETIGSRFVPSVVGDEDTRLRFRILMLSMLVEGLPRDRHDLLDASLSTTGNLVSMLFALPSFLTLLAALGGYALVSRFVERTINRRSEAETAPGGDDSPPQGDAT